MILFQAIAVFSALKAVTSKNPVSSVLWLILVFLAYSFVLMLLEVEFLGLIYVVVYIGAIAVLFLFVVMMLNIRLTELNSNFVSYFPISGLVVTAFGVLFTVISTQNLSTFPLYPHSVVWMDHLISVTNMEVIGQTLFGLHFPFFF